MKEKLVLSFWNYQNFGKYDERQSAKEWGDLNMNLASSFEYHEATHKPEVMLKLLDECHKNNLKLLIVDDRTHWKTLMKVGEKEFEKKVKASIADFGAHEAAFAFYVGDEPLKNDLPYAKKAVQIIQKNTALPAFINFNPQWLGDDFEKIMGVKGEDYEDMLDSFIKESGLKYIAYDCYGGMNINDKQAGLDMYFRNLNLFSRLAKKNNLPCWCSMLCVGHWNFRNPSIHDMKWQISTSIAHGMKGFQWFCLYEIEQRLDNFETYPYNFYGEKGGTYNEIAELNRYFDRVLGELLPLISLDRVFHYSQSYGGNYYYYDGIDPNIKNFYTFYRAPAIISRFIHKTTGELVYIFVNNSQTESSRLHITFVEKYEKFNTSIWLSPGGVYIAHLKSGENV